MERTKADQLAALILTVFQLNGVMSDWGDDFATSEGLSSARWKMLGALALADQPLTAPQIAVRMGVTRQGAQKQLNLLVQTNLIEARPNPMHMRSPLYALTQSGRNAFNAIDERWTIHASQAASSFSAADLNTALKVLTALVDVHRSAEKKKGHEE